MALERLAGFAVVQSGSFPDPLEDSTKMEPTKNMSPPKPPKP